MRLRSSQRPHLRPLPNEPAPNAVESAHEDSRLALCHEIDLSIACLPLDSTEKRATRTYRVLCY